MLVVVGGHSRNIGKTSVVCGIISELRDRNWTAVKVTQYGHGVCSHAGEPCECQDPIHPIAVSRETGADPGTDSARFLSAGAAESYWVRTPAGGLAEAMPRLRRILEAAENTIIESNSILRFVKPDVCLMVVDGAVNDFKETSLRFLDRASVLVRTSPAPLAWSNVPESVTARKPVLFAPGPDYRSPKLIELVERAFAVDRAR
jgi:molybdopterin-guanine dinucleotide biosynthesis protein